VLGSGTGAVGFTVPDGVDRTSRVVTPPAEVRHEQHLAGRPASVLVALPSWNVSFAIGFDRAITFDCELPVSVPFKRR